MTHNPLAPIPPERSRKFSKKTKLTILCSLLSIPVIIFGLGSIDASPDDYSAVTPVKREAPPQSENILFHMNQVTDLVATGSSPHWMDKLFRITSGTKPTGIK